MLRSKSKQSGEHILFTFNCYVFPLFSCWFRAVDYADLCQLLLAR